MRVFLAGSTGRDKSLKAMAAGACDYIVKPFESKEIMKKIIKFI